MVGTVPTRAARLSAAMPASALSAPKSATSSFFDGFFSQSSEHKLGVDLGGVAGALLDQVLAVPMAPTTPPRSAMEFQFMRRRVGEETGCGLTCRTPNLFSLYRSRSMHRVSPTNMAGVRVLVVDYHVALRVRQVLASSHLPVSWHFKHVHSPSMSVISWFFSKNGRKVGSGTQKGAH